MAAALRTVVIAGPAAASLVIALILSRALPRADSLAPALLWLLLIVASSLVTLIVLERFARRLLPLAALLNVSLLFPDKAPARFAVARRTGSPTDLRAKLESARASGDGSADAMQNIMELVLALSVHDKGTRGHSERTRVFTDLIAEELRVSPEGRAKLRWAALLHDIGKLEVPASILRKDGKPTDDEWKVLHRHPDEGARIVSGLMGWLGEWGLAVAHHHERFDGTGYPRGLSGHEISLAGRIVSVADTYEVMTAPRPYKRPMSVSAARRELVQVSGTQLDPLVVRAFLNVSVGRLWRTVGFGAWLAQLPALPRFLSSFGQLGSVVASGAATVAGAALVTVGGFGPAGFFDHHSAAAYVAPGPSISAAATSGTGLSPSQGRPGTTSGDPGTSSGAANPDGSIGPAVIPGPTGSAPTSDGSPTVTPMWSPTSQATAMPTATAPPSATAQPTPDPMTCGGCLANAPKSCTSYCSNSTQDLPNCTTYCQGKKFDKCQSHCFIASGDNPTCTQYCQTPNNNPKCVTYCVGHDDGACTSYCTGPNHPKCQLSCNAVAPLGGAAIVLFGARLRRRMGWTAASK